jgi:putative MATE family efflux protein
MALAYIRILFGGSVFMVSLFLVNAILRALGDAITPFVVLVISTVINFTLDPLLIFGLGPLPAFGVSGAATASVIARAVGLTIAAVFLARRYMPRPLFCLDYISTSIFGRVLAIGLPSSISMATRHVSGLIITAMVVLFGTEAVAAYGVCQRITFLVLMPGFGFAIGAAVLVGQNLGAGNTRRAELSAWIAVASYAVLVVLVSAALFFVPGHLVALFDPTARVVDLGSAFFAIVAPSLVFLPLGVVLSRSMSGAGYTFWPMVISVTVLLGVRVPMAWLLSQTMGMQGIFWAIAVPVVLEGVMMTGLFLVGGWKRKKVS